MTNGTQPKPEIYRRALPDLTSTQRLAGLEGPVEVRRDRLGIPHARATTRHDAFFAQGFVHAQDRLWQMEFDRRRAAGRMAECAGQAWVEWDSFARRTGLLETAQADYEAFDGETRAMFDAYARGVNAAIGICPVLPVEFQLLGIAPEPWEPWHSAAVFKVRHVLMGTWGTKLWRARVLLRLGPEAAAKLGTYGHHDGIVIVPPGERYTAALADLEEMLPGAEALAATFGSELEAGSNCWAVGGARTASGLPLVAGDPHRALDVPGVYYQNHIACDEFDVCGFSFGGVPGFPHFAHNRHVAWCITHGMADYQDLYIERFRRAGTGYEYEYRGEWHPAKMRRETIVVRDGAPVEVEVTRTHHGPVVVGDPARGYAIAMRYTATDVPNPGLRCLLPQVLATSVDELDAAMRDWVDPVNNMVMADRSGAIAYLHRGRVPLRAKANAWLPVPGWTGEHEWQGVVPFEELPRSRDPETGWIATANNRVVGDDYPYYLGLNYAPPHRALRLADRLSRLSKATVADMASVHADRVSLPSRVFVALLADVTPADERSAEARTRLLAWDGAMQPDLVAPTLYIAWRDQLGRLLLEQPRLAALRPNPFTGEPLALSPESRLWAPLVTMLEQGDTALLPAGATWQSVGAAALARAVAHLSELLGEDMDGWQWGRVHTTNPLHPLAAVFPDEAAHLNPPAVPLGGDSDTPQMGAILPGASYKAASMSVARYAFDLADWDNSAWSVPLGASAHPASPHYADQSLDWSEVRLTPMLYSWERIEAEAETTQRLEPA